MAEKPKFIYVNKKNELVWEVPGLGSVSFRDERHKKGAHGQVNAYLKRDGKEYRVGWLGYNVMSNPDAGHGQLRVSQIFVNDQFRRMGLGTIMTAVAQAKSPGKIVIRDIINPGLLKLSRNLLLKIEKDPELGFWASKENKEREKWKKAPKDIITKRKIKRR